MMAKRNLAKVKGMSEAKIDKIKEAATKIQVPPPRAHHPCPRLSMYKPTI